MVVQIQTGCEGLNLQKHYSEVYFVSPNWNPAVEAQAVARCHRIGQKKQVFVYKFIMNDFNNNNYKNHKDRNNKDKDKDKDKEISMDVKSIEALITPKTIVAGSILSCRRPKRTSYSIPLSVVKK